MADGSDSFSQSGKDHEMPPPSMAGVVRVTAGPLVVAGVLNKGVDRSILPK